jgi:hypothetical protein
MSNASGWGLTARLVTKHFGALGDRISETIANFDPETATEADRDRLVGTLRETAQLLATARASFDKEHDDVAKLQTNAPPTSWPNAWPPAPSRKPR